VLHNITCRQHLDVRDLQSFYEFLNPSAQLVHPATLLQVTIKVLLMSCLGTTVADEGV